MGITNHKKRVFSTFSLSLHLHKPREHKTTKTKPHVLHVLSFARGGEAGGEGRPAVTLAPTPSHSFAQEEFVRAICKQQSQPAFTATTAGKCKAPLVRLERGFGVPLSHSPNPEVTGKRGNKKCPTKTKKTHSSSFQEGIFHLQYFHGLLKHGSSDPKL